MAPLADKSKPPSCTCEVPPPMGHQDYACGTKVPVWPTRDSLRAGTLCLVSWRSESDSGRGRHVAPGSEPTRVSLKRCPYGQRGVSGVQHLTEFQFDNFRPGAEDDLQESFRPFRLNFPR